MSTLIFTPGPLHAQPAAGEHNWLVYSERDGHTIATVHDVYGGKPEMRGNAELYAKAPDMLRLLVEVSHQEYQNHRCPDRDALCHACRTRDLLDELGVQR